jgi:4-hydroxybenzoate polyprenyltransferase
MSGRALGYRLLGRRFDYLLHLRPAEWPIIAVHTAVGTVLAVGFAKLGSVPWPQFLVGLVVWVVCLNGATLAINSAFDRDIGDVAYLRQPPPPPRYLFVFGVALMAFGAGVAWGMPGGYRLAYGLCALMSLLYSVPPVRLKAIAGFDWLINMWGFGVLTPYAGWALTGLPVSPVGRTVLLAYCPLFAGLYPLTQLYQLEEDRARGDATMASVLGVRGSLAVSVASVGIAFGLFLHAGLVSGWLAGGQVGSQWIPLAIAAACWALVLGPWLIGGARLSSAAHQRRMYLALGAWAVTDVAILYGFGRSW